MLPSRSGAFEGDFSTSFVVQKRFIESFAVHRNEEPMNTFLCFSLVGARGFNPDALQRSGSGPTSQLGPVL